MTPQIVFSGDSSGKHNEKLSDSSTRIMESGVWKKQRVVVIIPAGESIPTKVALSHWGLMFPPNNGVIKLAAIGMEVGEAYTQTIQQILDHKELKDWEYILTIEHDNIPPADGVLKLIKRLEEHPELSCVGGLYWTKGEEGVPQIWGDPKDPQVNFRPQPPDPAGGLVECCGTGMGFNLWRMSMFKDERLRKPWFKTETTQGVATQDLYAWSDFRKNGHRCAIDCSVLVGHYDSQNDICW